MDRRLYAIRQFLETISLDRCMHRGRGGHVEQLKRKAPGAYSEFQVRGPVGRSPPEAEAFLLIRAEFCCVSA